MSVTISNFTPKPHTPFQWHTVSTAEFDRKQKLLRERFREARDCKARGGCSRTSSFLSLYIPALESSAERSEKIFVV